MDIEKEVTVGSMDLLNSMQLSENEAGLDTASKNMLQNIEVLAIILQNAVPEYKGYTLEEIKGFINEESFSDDTDVSQGRTNTVVSSDNVEYKALNEKTIDFDFLFSARNPRLSNERIYVRIFFDLEPMLDYHPGYPIEKRGYYYLSRRLSSQLSLITEKTDYSTLEKCYGIWICRDNIAIKERYTLSVYEIKNTKNTGIIEPKIEDYDLMTLIIVRLGDKQYMGDKNDEYYDLFKFLNLIMYPHDENFMEDMSEYVDFSNNPELWKEANGMRGLGACVYNDGFTEGEVKGEARGEARGEIKATDRLNKLNEMLLREKRFDDLERSFKDKDYQNELLVKYGLKVSSN